MYLYDANKYLVYRIPILVPGPLAGVLHVIRTHSRTTGNGPRS